MRLLILCPVRTAPGGTQCAHSGGPCGRSWLQHFLRMSEVPAHAGDADFQIPQTGDDFLQLALDTVLPDLEAFEVFHY